MKIHSGIKAGQGLGDVIADMAHLTGWDRFADAYTKITGKDCGCAARQEKLNQLFSFNALRPG